MSKELIFAFLENFRVFAIICGIVSTAGTGLIFASYAANNNRLTAKEEQQFNRMLNTGACIAIVSWLVCCIPSTKQVLDVKARLQEIERLK